MQRKIIVFGLFFLFLVLSSQTVEDLGLNLEQLEDKLFLLVNYERSSHGLPELRFDPLLRTMARAHSQKMIRENQLAHDFSGYEKLADRAAQAGLYFSEIGENVASGDTFVMRFFHEQLMSSPGHRENILNDHFRQLGIGIGLSGNVYYVTQEFANLFEPLAQIEVERKMEIKLGIQLEKRVELSQATAAEMKEYCRRMSALFLQDQSPKKISDSFGVASIYNFSFTDMETGFNRIIAATEGIKPIYWSLGVTFGHPVNNLGSVYALTLMLFPDLRDILAASDDLTAIILSSLNKIRKNNDLLSLGMVPKLTKPAADIARLFYQSPATQDFIKNRDHYTLILAYLTPALDVIPDNIVQKIINCPQILSIGINVFYPLAEGLPGNYFIVAILGK